MSLLEVWNNKAELMTSSLIVTHDGTREYIYYDQWLHSHFVPSPARMSQSTAASPAMVPSPFVHEEIGLFVGIALESIFYGALQFSSSSFVIVILPL